MKCTFQFNGRVYVSPSRIQARRFIQFWFGWDWFMHECKRKRNGLTRLKTTWNIKTVERAPQWAAAFFVMNENGEMEYMKTSMNDGTEKKETQKGSESNRTIPNGIGIEGSRNANGNGSRQRRGS